MTPILAPLPNSLTGGPFTVVSARAAGVTYRRLRHPGLVSPTRGVRATGAMLTLAETTAAYAEVLSGRWAWSHATAAELQGLTVPMPWRPGMVVTVMRPDDEPRVRRVGIRSVRGLETRGCLANRFGMVVEPLATWCDLVPTLTMEDAVVLGDQVLALTGRMADPLSRQSPADRLRAEVDRRSGGRGAPAMRALLPLLSADSRSPQESRARLLFRLSGLPDPQVNAQIVGPTGWLATADFVWRQRRVIVEYQGDQHRTDRRRWQADLQRYGLLQDDGWTVILMTAADLANPRRRHEFVTRLARALGVSLGLGLG